jgi:Flp pilus assembly protein TadG
MRRLPSSNGIRRGLQQIWSRLREDCGSQIVEFAVTLPLLAVIVVGIFDFSQAFGLKQKLSNAAREGARMGSNQPTNDLSQGTPPSVIAIAESVGQYMQTVKLNDCGLANGTATAASSGNLAWTFTGNGCALNPVVTIKRGFVTTATMASPYPSGTLTIDNTQVNVQYPYQWKFGNVITLLVPSANYAGTTTVQATATMQNLN